MQLTVVLASALSALAILGCDSVNKSQMRDKRESIGDGGEKAEGDVKKTEQGKAPSAGETKRYSILEGSSIEIEGFREGLAADATLRIDGVIPQGLKFDALNGRLDFTPSEADGPHTFSFSVIADGIEKLVRKVELEVRERNEVPTFTPWSDQIAAAGTMVNVNFVATDVDIPANKLSYTLVGEKHGASLDAASGAFSWQVPAKSGDDVVTFTIEVADDGTPPLKETKTLQVGIGREPPQILLAKAADKYLSPSDNVITVFVRDTDASDFIKLSSAHAGFKVIEQIQDSDRIATLPGASEISLDMSVTAFKCEWSVTDDEKVAGEARIKITASDKFNLSSEQTVSVKVNRAPILVGNPTVNDQTNWAQTGGWFDVADPDGDAIIVILKSFNGGPISTKVSQSVQLNGNRANFAARVDSCEDVSLFKAENRIVYEVRDQNGASIEVPISFKGPATTHLPGTMNLTLSLVNVIKTYYQFIGTDECMFNNVIEKIEPDMVGFRLKGGTLQFPENIPSGLKQVVLTIAQTNKVSGVTTKSKVTISLKAIPTWTGTPTDATVALGSALKISPLPITNPDSSMTDNYLDVRISARAYDENGNKSDQILDFSYLGIGNPKATKLASGAYEFTWEPQCPDVPPGHYEITLIPIDRPYGQVAGLQSLYNAKTFDLTIADAQPCSTTVVRDYYDFDANPLEATKLEGRFSDGSLAYSYDLPGGRVRTKFSKAIEQTVGRLIRWSMTGVAGAYVSTKHGMELGSGRTHVVRFLEYAFLNLEYPWTLMGYTTIDIKRPGETWSKVIKFQTTKPPSDKVWSEVVFREGEYRVRFVLSYYPTGSSTQVTLSGCKTLVVDSLGKSYEMKYPNMNQGAICE